ncbi:MAG: DUF192 domain-containing protein [Nitrospiraceae bacterium]
MALIASAFTLLLLAVVVALSPTTDAGSLLNTPNDVLIPIKTPNGVTIHAELADTTLKRAQGLMYREHLSNDRGMLFIFGDAQLWTFWMKNTKIPLDIIWMDGKKKIIHIERNVPICTRTDDGCPQYQPHEVAEYVLEIAGGRADALNLKRGVKLQFP